MIMELNKNEQRKEMATSNTGIDGNVILFGVNIFQYRWEDTGKILCLNKNSLLQNGIPVYRVTIRGCNYEFAAQELSNCVWSFYTCDN